MRRNKLAGGLATAGLVIGLLGASAAGADPAPGKDACKNGGYQLLGFANQGQCVKAANQAAKTGEPFPPFDVEEVCAPCSFPLSFGFEPQPIAAEAQ